MTINAEAARIMEEQYNNGDLGGYYKMIDKIDVFRVSNGFVIKIKLVGISTEVVRVSQGFASLNSDIIQIMEDALREKI